MPLRCHATGFGEVAAKGVCKVKVLLAQIAANEAIPAPGRKMMEFLGQEIIHLDERLAKIDTQLQAQHASNAMSQLLVQIPGIGPITALRLATTVEPDQFTSGRHFAAWLGMTPRQNSSGGKQRLGGISRHPLRSFPRYRRLPRSCPRSWCNSALAVMISGGHGRDRHSAAMGRQTRGSSLSWVTDSRVM
jgi:hypothetical protein